MAQTTDDRDQKPETDEAPAAEASPDALVPAPVQTPEGEDDGTAARSLGTQRYVHAAFIAAGVFCAFVAGKLFAAGWGHLTEWPAAVRAVPALVSYPEEQRDSFAAVAGIAIGALAVLQTYRRSTVRRWADEVTAELEKVTWPSRETVVNGTLVVVITGAVATVYVAVLDRFWGFLTTLVYGT